MLGLPSDTPRKLGIVLDDDKLSPFWARDFGRIAPGLENNPSAQGAERNKCNDLFEPVMSALRVGSMIIGHTPQATAANETCRRTLRNAHGTIEQGGLIRADIGASRAFAIQDHMDPRPVHVVEILERTGEHRRVIIH
jgi:hypothetical protein